MNKILGLWIPVILFMVTLGTPAHGNNPENWFLMARHGECAKIESLQKKIPELEKIKNPDEFLKLMKEQGHEVKVNKMQETGGNAIEVNIPDKGLYLIFVREVLCKGRTKI